MSGGSAGSTATLAESARTRWGVARLSFGIKTIQQMTTYEAIRTVWKEADGIPVMEHAWLFDHLAPIAGAPLDGPALDGWTMLAALAVETSRIRLGLMVAGNTYRHPGVAAKIATTVDIISNGRLEFGIGAGWNEYEHESMGIPLYGAGERLRRLREACTLIKMLFTQPVTDFDGQYYQLKEARHEPKPVQKPYPPFMIGGSGEKLTLRVVAEHADAWNYDGAGTIERFTHLLGVLRQHCADVGRDPAELTISAQTLVHADDLQRTIDHTNRLVEAGATHLLLNIRPPFPDKIATRLAEEVVPKIGV